MAAEQSTKLILITEKAVEERTKIADDLDSPVIVGSGPSGKTEYLGVPAKIIEDIVDQLQAKGYTSVTVMSISDCQ